jgi:hypothetical protein
LGTFNPVEVEDLSKHKMDSEELKITQAACDIVNDAKERKTYLYRRYYVDACCRKFGFFTWNAKSF